MIGRRGCKYFHLLWVIWHLASGTGIPAGLPYRIPAWSKGRSILQGMGLVQEVFRESICRELKGNIGIRHVRYSTTGATTLENAQPLVLKYLKGSLALAHNGNLVNAVQLRDEMEHTGAIFHTTIDSEIIAYHIARERIHSATVEEAIRKTVQKIRGAYGLVIMGHS